MTTKMVIEKLIYAKENWSGLYRCSTRIALDMAIEALERQIPKKVLYVKQDYGTPWFCPECEADQVKVDFFCTDGSEPKEKLSYCWKCGQAIDWSE